MAVTVIQVQKYLKGMKYPASKERLVSTARDQGAPRELIAILERLPEQTYSRVTDISGALKGVR